MTTRSVHSTPRKTFWLVGALACGLLVGNAATAHEAWAVQVSSTPTASITTSAMSALSATLLETPTPEPCPDSFEDDGVPWQAQLLVTGDTQVHMFCLVGDADWLKFFANKDKGYSLETSGLAVGVDTYLNLFAPDGQTLLTSNDDKPGEHGPSQILFYPHEDGWYYLQAKNQGDIGYAGLRYSVSLRQVDLPTSTPSTPTEIATPTPSATPLVTTATISATPSQTPLGTLGIATPRAFVADLLHPDVQKGDGGLDVFVAGPADSMQPDGLEPNDERVGARAVNVGARYTLLNFVPQAADVVDADYFSFRAKPGLCYQVTTGEVSSGLDTTLLLWQWVPAREEWELVAQNDDAQSGSPDLGSAVRWCASRDTAAALEIRNYGGAVATDPRGKSYSLSLSIDPPTPTIPATPVPTRVPATVAPAMLVAPQRDVHMGPGAAEITQAQAPQVKKDQQAQDAPPTQAPPPQPTIEATAISPTPAMAVSPTPTMLPAPTETPAPPSVSVDVVAYVGDQFATGPNPGDGIVDLPVLLVDVRTNAVIQQANTDRNGHAGLAWQWQGPVRVSMPAFRWGKTLQLSDFKSSTGTEAGAGVGGSLMLQARMSSYLLPGILP